MKRIITVLIAMILCTSTVVSAKSIASTESTASAESIASAEPITGGWEPVEAEAAVLPEEAQTAFEKATEGLLGATYTPVALLSTQVVAGTNYCILCQVTPVVPDAVPSWDLVYIYEDLEGNAEIMNIWEIYVDRHAQPEETEED